MDSNANNILYISEEIIKLLKKYSDAKFAIILKIALSEYHLINKIDILQVLEKFYPEIYNYIISLFVI